MKNRERLMPFLTDAPACPKARARPQPRARAVLAAVSVSTATILGLCAPAIAQAPEQTPSRNIPLQVETHLGWQDPLGSFGLALLYDGGGRFSGGLGVGLDSLKSDTMPPVGFFGRARLLRWGWGSLGVGGTLSRGHDYHEQAVGQSWTFGSSSHSYRATGTLGAEFAHRGWSLRLDAGIGYLLNDPQCAHSEVGNFFRGSCDSPQIPAAVQTAGEHARVIPSLTATIGYHLTMPGWPGSPSADVAPGYKSPEKALRLSFWSTLPLALAGTMMLGLSVADGNNISLALAGAGSLALGLSFGPSIGYAYSNEPLRAWGLGTVRLVGIVAGTLAIVSGLVVDEDTHKDDPTSQALGVCLIGAAFASAIYDIAAAPKAARRANGRHGLTNLSLAPVAIPSRGSPSPGLSLMGQF
jgi:hypothetical protein